MKVSGIHWAILVCALLLVPGVSAQNIEQSGNYSVTPGDILKSPPGIMPLSSATISQGETVWFSKVVPAGTTYMNIDLNWGDTSDILSLTVIAPDTTLGPYYDNSDGIINGRIYLSIFSSSGLAPGTWNFRVYGEKVTGIQSISFSAY